MSTTKNWAPGTTQLHHYCLNYRATTKKLISEYEEKKDKFMGGTTLSQFKKLLPASSATDKLPRGNSRLVTPGKKATRKKHIIMKLQNYWGERTLKDLKMLTQMLGDPGDDLQLSKVTKNSIIVHWLYPTESEVEEALTAAAKSLHAEGVEQISIVLDLCEPPQGIAIILLMGWHKNRMTGIQYTVA